MPKASKATASGRIPNPGGEVLYEELAGGWTVSFDTVSLAADMADQYKGLPDDSCPLTHLGYVLKGRMTITTPTGVEEFKAGDAYYLAPGHTPSYEADTEVVDFTPTEEMRRLMERAAAVPASEDGETPR